MSIRVCSWLGAIQREVPQCGDPQCGDPQCGDTQGGVRGESTSGGLLRGSVIGLRDLGQEKWADEPNASRIDFERFYCRRLSVRKRRNSLEFMAKTDNKLTASCCALRCEKNCLELFPEKPLHDRGSVHILLIPR
jgi:hypothetical protein